MAASVLGPVVSEFMQALQGPFLRLLQPFGSHGHEPCWISKPDVLEACLSCANLKSWGAFLGYKPFTPQGAALHLCFLLIVVCRARDGVCDEIGSQPLLPL